MPTITNLEVEGSPVTRVALPSGHVVLIDAADLELAKQYHWYVVSNPAGNLYAYGYPLGRASESYPRLAMHRVLLDAPDGFDVDHRNGNGLDNRRANIRVATRSQNNANRDQKPGRSGYRGVTWNIASGRWQARVWVAGKCRHVGLFEDAWEAAQAYNAAATETWGEFARLNERVSA